MLDVVMLALTLAAAPAQGSEPSAAPVRPDTGGARTGRSVVEQPAPRFQAAPAPWPGAVAVGASSSSGEVAAGSVAPAAAAAAPADSPGVHRRPRAVQYSDWYGRRLAIHRVASYALLPLLAAQYYTGTQLMAKGSDAPLWVIRSHAPLATASAVLFGANTVTGVWNLWDARADPNGRFARTVHGLGMLVADAGFLAAGSMGHAAVQNGSTRTLHQTIALSSMGVALVSYAIMLPPFRR